MLSFPALARPAAALQQARRPLVIAGGTLVTVWFVLRVWDGAGSGGGFLEFTLIGISLGCIYAIGASGLVLTYTTTGVFNFAHGAVGMLAAYLYFQLWDAGVPLGVALILMLGVIAPAMGLILERLMRSFKDAPPGTTLTVTIALTILLIGLVQATFPEGVNQRVLPYIFGERRVEIFGARLRWDEFGYLIVAVAVAVGLRALLYRTRTGVAMRAVVDDSSLAALNGAPPVRIARFSWVLGTMLAALAGVLLAPSTNPLEAVVLTFFVTDAYGAAVFGRLRSLPLTFGGAILLGLFRSYAPISFPSGEVWGHLQVGLPALFLFFVLLLLPEEKLRVGRVIGRDTPRVPGLRRSLTGAALFVPAMMLVAAISGDYLDEMTTGLVYGVLLLSVVLLTGYSGQISLAQYVFFGLGAFAMGKVAGGDSILGMAAAAAIAVPIGVIVALPALRLQGLYLALVTFALAVIGKQVIFQDTRVYGLEGVPVGRLELFGLDFSGDRAFAALCAIVFALVAIGVLALRRGPFGRRLAALRDSPAACSTLGLDVRRTKLAVFILSSAIAGLAGALFGGQAGIASQLAFEPILNLLLFLFAFVGGITTVTGALLGGMLFAVLPLVQSDFPDLAGLVFAAVAATAVALGKQPNGMAGLLYSKLSRLSPERRPAARPRPTPAPTRTSEVADAVA